MIISHQHRYLFIEVPLTASFAIRGELCTWYGGEPILHKHATYSELRSVSTVDADGYFRFATVRNPLDVVVSRYCKLKFDHKGVFSDPTSAHDFRADYSDQKKYKFILENDASFETFFSRYYSHRPYGDMIDLVGCDLDFVIRYENLQDDFGETLRLLGLDQVRPIPQTNQTQKKESDWKSYYTPETIEQAKKTFGPFMKKWGYQFPDAWGSAQVSPIDEVKFHLSNSLRSLYHCHVRYSNQFHARTIRKLRAQFLDF